MEGHAEHAVAQRMRSSAEHVKAQRVRRLPVSAGLDNNAPEEVVSHISGWLGENQGDT